MASRTFWGTVLFKKGGSVQNRRHEFPCEGNFFISAILRIHCKNNHNSSPLDFIFDQRMKGRIMIIFRMNLVKGQIIDKDYLSFLIN